MKTLTKQQIVEAVSRTESLLHDAWDIREAIAFIEENDKASDQVNGVDVLYGVADDKANEALIVIDALRQSLVKELKSKPKKGGKKKLAVVKAA